MNATVECQHTEGAGSPPASGASSGFGGASTPSSAAATPRPWSLNRIRLPVTESLRSASTPVRRSTRLPQQFASSVAQGRKKALSTPLEDDSLSSDDGTESDCAADESSSEFHGSGRNVANTAFQNRMSGVSRGDGESGVFGAICRHDRIDGGHNRNQEEELPQEEELAAPGRQHASVPALVFE
ncbi:hypothetical protein MTO96_003860 [Rhipicephalus appendiculatus]